MSSQVNFLLNEAQLWAIPKRREPEPLARNVFSCKGDFASYCSVSNHVRHTTSTSVGPVDDDDYRASVHESIAFLVEDVT